MMKRETIMRRKGLKWPVYLNSRHIYRDLPPMACRWMSKEDYKDWLAGTLFDLSLTWGIDGIDIGKCHSTIWFVQCVDWDGKLHDTNIDADTIEHIISELD